MCTTFHDQCYWEDLKIAQKECSTWVACKYLYQSDRHTPAASGNPVYWARGYGDIITEKDAVLWKQQGIYKYMNTSLHIYRLSHNGLIASFTLLNELSF